MSDGPNPVTAEGLALIEGHLVRLRAPDATARQARLQNDDLVASVAHDKRFIARRPPGFDVKALGRENRHRRLAFAHQPAPNGPGAFAMGADDGNRGQSRARETGGGPFPSAGVAASRAIRAIVISNVAFWRARSRSASAAKRALSSGRSTAATGICTGAFFHNHMMRLSGLPLRRLLRARVREKR